LETASSTEAEPFWAATRERRLTLPWCTSCDRPHWFPRAVCPHCGGRTFDWRDASGDATVYAVTVHHTPGLPHMADRVPYAVALVDLPEGVRMMTNVVEVDDPTEVRVGDAVRIVWEELPDGRNLPVFGPA
jgi:uncharacterized OB-fold protein